MTMPYIVYPFPFWYTLWSFQFLAIRNEAAMNVFVQVDGMLSFQNVDSFQNRHMLSFLLDKYLGVEATFPRIFNLELEKKSSYL